jgi:hypothetical protein
VSLRVSICADGIPDSGQLSEGLTEHALLFSAIRDLF